MKIHSKRSNRLPASLEETIKKFLLRTREDVFSFVPYSSDETSMKVSSTRHMYFLRSRAELGETYFLDKARCILDNIIAIFALAIEKGAAGKYSIIDDTISRLRTARDEFNHLTLLDSPLSDELPELGGRCNLYFVYHIALDQQHRDAQIYAAICDFFLLIYLPYSPFGPVDKLDRGNYSYKPVRRLFANSKDIDFATEFGIPKSISDGVTKVIRSANHSKAIQQFRESRTSTFKTGGPDDPELTVDSVAMGIKAADQFADQLMRIKDAKILQTFCALWKYANIQDSFQFRNVPISDVMEIVLKKGKKTNFSVGDRRQFTAALQYLASLTISLQVQSERNTKKGKKQSVLLEERGVKLFRLIAEYTLQKQYYNLPKEQLEISIHYDNTAIVQFSGELLPGYNQGFSDRSNVYHDALLEMDANKDQKAVVLGFTLQTRFNQFADKSKPVQLDRGYLIELCDYQKTDQTNSAVATNQLKNVLDKLKSYGLISRYENLTRFNAQKVSLYPATEE